MQADLIMYAWKHADNNSSLLARVNEEVNWSPTANLPIPMGIKLTDFICSNDPSEIHLHIHGHQETWVKTEVFRELSRCKTLLFFFHLFRGKSKTNLRKERLIYFAVRARGSRMLLLAHFQNTMIFNIYIIFFLLHCYILNTIASRREIRLSSWKKEANRCQMYRVFKKGGTKL